MRDIDDDDMSMDDILASIRRYVADDEQKSDERIIHLTPEQEVSQKKKDVLPKKDLTPQKTTKETSYADPIQASACSLSKLQEIKAKNSSGSVEQFLFAVIKEWLDKHMPPIVEKTVQREIEKIKKAM